MFIVKKKVSGKDYYYLRKSKRVDGKVKAVNIAYLGKDKKEAENKAEKIKEDLKNKKAENKGMGEVKEPKKNSKIEQKNISIDEMAMFCKRKGFVYPSAEIYGGIAGFMDFGHLGVELNNNLKKDWWNFHVRQREDIVGIDGSIITSPRVWQASGHEDSFNDVLVICKKCKKPNKIDKHEIGKVNCINCQGEYDWKSAKEIEQMFKTKVGIEGSAYLRPETAQLIFSNFKFVQENARLKLPFGIAQIGKAFRNEIAPRDFLFRVREFEQMEIEYFVDPNEECPYEIGDTEVLIYSEEIQKKELIPKKMRIKKAFEEGIIKTKWHAYWLEQELLWYQGLGVGLENFRLRQHVSDEKSHYALDTWDLEYKFPFGWKELQGMANRTVFDLKQHQKHSKTNLEIMNKNNEKIIPHVVCEPSQGVGRALMVFLFNAYNHDAEKNNIIMRFHPKLAPIKAAIFPIIKDEKYQKISQEIFNDLSSEFNVVQDKSGSIGRRYARNDEIGTPMCITVDEETLKDKMATIRDRDSTKQVRVKVAELREIVRKVIEGEDLLKLGELVETRVK